MKRDLSIVLSVLMIFSLCTIDVKADDTEITKELIDQWEEKVDLLSDTYFNDLQAVEFTKASIEEDKQDLILAQQLLQDSQSKVSDITTAFNNALAEKQEAESKLSSKESEVQQIENSLNASLSVEKEKLNSLKTQEESAATLALELAAGPSLATLLDEYETSELNVTYCQEELDKELANLETFKLLEEQEFIDIAQAQVDSWTSKLESAQNERDIKKAAYEDELYNNTLANNQQQAIDNYNAIKQELDNQQAIVDNMVAALNNNQDLLNAKDALYALQFDWAIKEDTYIKAKQAYDDINNEVSAATILVETLTNEIETLENTLTVSNENLINSQSEYNQAVEYLNSIKGIYNNNLIDTLTKLINKSIDYSLYTSDSVDYYKAIKQDGINVLNDTNSSKDRIEGCIDSINQAYELLTVKGTISEVDQDSISVDETISHIQPKVNNIIVPSTLTPNEQKAIQEGKDINVSVNISYVEHSDDNKATTLINQIVDNSELNLAMNLDITLLASIEDSSDTRVISNTSDKVSITITIPQEYINYDVNRVYKVIRIHDNNGTLIHDTLSGIFNKDTNEFTFETDKFSTYAIVYQDVFNNSERKQEANKENKDNSSNSTADTNTENGVKLDHDSYVWSNKVNGYVYKVVNTACK